MPVLCIAMPVLLDETALSADIAGSCFAGRFRGKNDPQAEDLDASAGRLAHAGNRWQYPARHSMLQPFYGGMVVACITHDMT